MQPLLDISIGSQLGPLIGSGIALGRDPFDAPLWSEGKNVSFRDNEVTKGRGWVNKVSLPSTIKEISQANVDGEKRAYLGTNTSLYVWRNQSTLHTLGTGYGGGNWDLVPWGTWLVATNGVDVPQVWKNNLAVPATALGGVTFTFAKIMFRFLSAFIFAANTSNGQNALEWCSDDDIETWTPATTNTAGQLILRDLDSEIMGALSLGQNFLIYSKQSAGLLNFVGGVFEFGVVNALKGVGLVSKTAGVEIDRKNYGFSHQGLWVNDGVSLMYNDDQGLRTWIKRNVNFDAADQIEAWHNPDQTLVVWWVPTGGSTVNNRGIGFNYKTGAPHYFDYAPDASARKEVFDAPLLAFGTQLAYGETGVDAGSSPLESYIQTKPLDCGDQEIFKRLQFIRLQLQKFAGSLRLYVGFQKLLSDPITWLPDTEADRINNLKDREGVFISLKLVSSGLSADWKLSGFKLLGEPGGYVV